LKFCPGPDWGIPDPPGCPQACVGKSQKVASAIAIKPQHRDVIVSSLSACHDIFPNNVSERSKSAKERAV
jgi:hypothetical protein